MQDFTDGTTLLTDVPCTSQAQQVVAEESTTAEKPDLTPSDFQTFHSLKDQVQICSELRISRLMKIPNLWYMNGYTANHKISLHSASTYLFYMSVVISTLKGEEIM